ncbi:MAG: 4-hydroxy-3-methylbut-2-enyl diphosphate reductase, partial [Clostridia bacterium]|nr:4-hydroxy-3-methylbut-2-enyl diphosphate reductase [Clostridia bacterium]
MEIILSKSAGFCPGVRRADDAVKALIKDRPDGELIFTIGPLIHNEVYIDSLKSLGVFPVELYEVENIVKSNPDKQLTFVIRTHGISLDGERLLRQIESENPRVKIIDMTCPSVKRIQRIAAEKTGDDSYFLLFGSRTHPESVATISYAKGDKCIFSSLEELKDIDFKGKVPILCAQTTANLLQFIQIKKFLKKLYTNAIFFDTICSVTENRQYEAIEIAKASDVMIVIGGRDSSNTHKLYSLCKEVCPRTQWITTAAELSTDFPDSAHCAGITAGASTPDGIIMEVFKAMENFSQMLEGSLKTLHTGETVTGTVFT